MTQHANVKIGAAALARLSVAGTYQITYRTKQWPCLLLSDRGAGMTGFLDGGGIDEVSSSVDTGDIGHSLRLRGAQYLSKTITTDATSTLFHSKAWKARCHFAYC